MKNKDKLNPPFSGKNNNKDSNDQNLNISDYELFSLPKNEIRIISKTQGQSDGVIIFSVKGKVIKHKCPKCGSYNTKRVGNGYEIHTVNHMHLSNYLVIKLEIHKRRFICKDCEKRNKNNKNDDKNNKGGGSTFTERFSFLKPGCDYTEGFKTYILREWEFQSLSELARKFRTSEKLIYTVINSVSLDSLIQVKMDFLKTLEEIYIGIDEFSFSGRNYICQITELKKKRTIGVLKTNSKEELLVWLNKIDINTLKKIKGIASDMNNTYKATIQSFIYDKLKYEVNEVDRNKSLGIADHFHLKQLFEKLIMEVYNMNNWMIKAGYYDKIVKDICTLETINFNKYRTDRLEFNVREFREYKPKLETITNENGEIIEEIYKPITLGYFLSKRYIDLLLLKSEKLSRKQAHRLNQILFEFDPKGYLKEAYLSKELFNEAVEKKDETILEKVISDLKSALHYKIKTCGNTLEKWKQEIINFFKTEITNAFTEGKNTKAKLLKRMAYGYKIKDNYIKRLLLCL